MQPTATDDCPRCGAPRPHEGDETELQDCTYCGAALPRRRQPESPPKPTSSVPKLAFLAPIVSALVLAVIGAVSAWQVSAPAPRPVLTPSPEAVSEWASEAQSSFAGSELERARFRVLPDLLLMPDASEERLLALLQPLEGGPPLLASLDTSTGRSHWERTFEAAAGDFGVRAVIGKLLIIATPKSISGVEPTSGEVRWQRPLSQPPSQLCASSSTVGVIHKAQAISAFKLTTGEPAISDASRCQPVYTSRSAAPNFEFNDSVHAQQLLPKGSRLHALRGLLPQRGKAQVVLGTDGGATGRASVGVVSSRKWLWQATLASTLNDNPSLLEPALAAVRLDRVVVPYSLPDASLHLVSFELKDGRRDWARAIEGAKLEPTRADSQMLVALDGTVLFCSAGKLWAVRLADGSKAWSIGGP